MASRDLDQQDALPLPPAAASATETQANDSPSVAAVPCPHIFGFFAPPNPSLCSICNNTSILADAPAPSSSNRSVEPPPSSRSFRMRNPFIDHISPDPNASPSSLSRPSCPDFFSRTSFRIKRPFGDLSADPPVPSSSWSFALPKLFPTGEPSGTEGDVITEEGSLKIRRKCNSRSEASELVSSQLPVTQRSCTSPLPDPSLIVPLEIAFPAAEKLFSLSRAKPLPTPKPQESASLGNAVPVPESALGTVNSLPVSVAVATKAPAGALKDRCRSCRKRLCLGATFKCRCRDVFCSSHRFPDQHTCTFDIKALDRQLISKANPVVKADKLQNRI